MMQIEMPGETATPIVAPARTEAPFHRQSRADAAYYSRLGPIAPFLLRDEVPEVMVMGDREIYIEVGGLVVLTEARFGSE
ncbi:MAG TPA: hypothetical protein VIM74_04605, partial [Casimicrobiaceae bacterium]